MERKRQKTSQLTMDQPHSGTHHTPGRILQWTVMGADRYQMCGRTVDRLPPGAYACHSQLGSAVFQRRVIHVDELIELPGSLPCQILQEIEHFWTLEERFRKLGFLHRRGYLLYGKQGSGKSSLIHQLVSRVIRQGHVAFFCESPGTFIVCVEQFRAVEPERPIVCLFEDIDATIEHYGSTAILQWLDGSCQVDKAVNIATTNYPEKLDRRIVSRPRRFDRFLRIDAPDSRLRDAYFARKLPDLSARERRQWVKLSEGLTFAALTELIISVCCLGNGLEESATRLKELDKHDASSEEYDADQMDDDSDDRLWRRKRARRRTNEDIPF